MGELDEIAVERILDTADDEAMVDSQLVIMDLWLTSNISSMEQVLPRLISSARRSTLTG